MNGEHRQRVAGPVLRPVRVDPGQPVGGTLDGRERRGEEGALAGIDALHEAGERPGEPHDDGDVEDMAEKIACHRRASEPLGPQQRGDEVDEQGQRHREPEHGFEHRAPHSRSMPRTATASARKPAAASRR